MDDAPNYGNTGAPSHELTHGFDDEGRQFDAKGNLKDWWNQAGCRRFRRARRLRFHAVFAIHRDRRHQINGKLTLGEDVATWAARCWPTWRGKTQLRTRSSNPSMDSLRTSGYFIGMHSGPAATSARQQTPACAHRSAFAREYRINGVVSNHAGVR